MSTFRVYHLRHLRRQPLRTVLAAIALGAAVASTVVSMVVVQSIDRSVEKLLLELAGPSPLRVVGPLTRGGVAPDTIDAVTSTDGVAAAVPVVQGVVFAQNDRGVHEKSVLALGVDCRAEAIFGEFGCNAELVNKASNEPVVMSASLKTLLGEDGFLRTDVGRVPIRDVPTNDQLDATNGGGIVLYELSAAQRVLDRGHNVDVVYVKPDTGTDIAALRSGLQGAVGEHNMVLRRDEPSTWLTSRGPLLTLLGLVVLVALGLSILLVYNIVALSLAERRRDLAIVSAVGTSPSRVTRNVLVESAAVGVIGGVAGIGIGMLMARPVVTSLASIVTEQATGMRVTMYVGPSVYVAGILIGVLASVIAAVVPARRASRVDLAAELHGRGQVQEEAPRRSLRRIVVLASIVVVALVLSYLSQRNGAIDRWQPPVGALALLLSSFASFALAGSVAPILLRAVLGGLRSRAGTSRVALSSLVSQPRRAVVIAAAVASAVGMAAVLGSLVPAIKGAVKDFDGASTGSSVHITSLPLNNGSNVDSRISRRTLGRLAALDGTGEIAETRCTEVSDVQGVYAFCGLGGGLTSPVILGDDMADVIARGDAVVATGTARSRGLRPGDTMRIATPTGFRDVRVGAIWVYARDNGHSVVVSVARHQELIGPTTPHSLTVQPERGVSPSELARRIETARLDPDLEVRTSAALATHMAAEVGMQVEPFWLMQRVLLVVALVGTLSTLLLIGVQRRRELGVLGAVGFSPSALGRMTLLEALAAGAAGAVLGAIASVASFETLRNAAATTVGARPPFNFEITPALSAIVVALVIVAMGGAWPAWRTSRVQIVEAIRDE